MASIIAIANNKGGTSKTTTCASLAVALHELGQKPILMVDCDPTGALSTSFGISPGQDEKTLYHALLEPATTIKQVTRQLRPGLDLVPANRELSAAEMILPTKTGGEQLLRKKLEAARRDYAIVLLDCPPNLGKLTVNALTAADGLVIPLTAAYLSLNPLAHLFETVEADQTRIQVIDVIERHRFRRLGADR